MVRGSKDHSNVSGLPGLQQQMQDTFSCYVLLVLTFLQTNTEGKKSQAGQAETTMTGFADHLKLKRGFHSSTT